MRLHRLVVAALIVWVAIAVAGAIVQSFVVTVLAMALILGTGALAEVTHRPHDQRVPDVRRRGTTGLPHLSLGG